jgi:hypothetical protein
LEAGEEEEEKELEVEAEAVGRLQLLPCDLLPWVVAERRNCYYLKAPRGRPTARLLLLLLLLPRRRQPDRSSLLSLLSLLLSSPPPLLLLLRISPGLQAAAGPSAEGKQRGREEDMVLTCWTLSLSKRSVACRPASCCRCSSSLASVEAGKQRGREEEMVLT